MVTDNVLSNLEAIFLVLKLSGNESWKNQFSVKVWILVKPSSATTPGVCLAGALFFQKKHVPFQKNMYIGVLGSK